MANCHGFAINEEVEAVGGSHKGVRGHVVGATECFVKLQKQTGEVVKTKPQNLRACAASAAGDSARPAAPPTQPSRAAARSTSGSSPQGGVLAAGERARVIKGTYLRVTGTIVGTTAKQYIVRPDERFSCEISNATFRVAHSSVERDQSSESDGDDASSTMSLVGALGESLSVMSLAEPPTLSEVPRNSDHWVRVQGRR
jgi:hypothetical protein